MKKGVKIMKIIILSLVAVIAVLLIYFNIPYPPYKSAFIKKMRKRAQNVEISTDLCTKEEIARLPKPLQRYCEYIGLEGTKKYLVVRANFYKTKFVMDANKDKKIIMDYDLWLFYDRPYRSAFCSSSVKGIPFDGLDYCTDNQEGGMKGYLGKVIQLFDVRDKQGYKAGLISWIAESVTLNPAGLLSEYLSYELIDDKHVKATIHYEGITGSGVFTFNEDGAITEFYSDERQVEKINGVKTSVGWLCLYKNYQECNNKMKLAKSVQSIKIFPDKQVVYFDSDNFEVHNMK